MNIYSKALIPALGVCALACATLVYALPTAPSLGTSQNFAVLAGSTITNTGATVINGNLGLSPGTSVTGFPPGILNGTQHVADAEAAQAQSDLITAYNDAAGRTPVTTIPAELGGTTQNPGVYDSVSGTFGITGSVTLDAHGDPSAVFIFKTASSLVTAGGSTVILTGGAQACNVFWQVGSSATLGVNSVFMGNILALTAATLTTGARVEGRVLTRNAAVTLDSNVISVPSCATPIVPVAVVATTTPIIVTATTTVAVAATSSPTVVPAATSTPAVVASTTAPVVVVVPVFTPPTSFVPQVVNVQVPSFAPQSPNTGAGGDPTPTLLVLATSLVVLFGSGLALRRELRI